MSKKDIAAAKLFIMALSAIFIACEILFAGLVLYLGDGDLGFSLLKTLVFTSFIFFLLKGKNWSKWVLSGMLIVYAGICLLAGFEGNLLALKVLGVYYLYFGVILHLSKKVQLYLKLKSKAHLSQEPTHVMPKEPVASLEPDAFLLQGNVYEFPRLVRRYQSMFIDSMLLLSIAILLSVVIEDSEHKSVIVITILAILMLTYEPVLTSYSATLGQRIMNISVRDYDFPEQKITLPRSYLRYFTKGFLGWISFLSIHSNPEHRALHDFAGKSVMIKHSSSKKSEALHS